MKAYIAGPMTNREAWNFPAFHAAVHLLCQRGWDAEDIVNPADNFDGDTTLPRERYLAVALRQVLECDRVYVLPGWEESPGASLEVQVARAAGIPVLSLATHEPVPDRAFMAPTLPRAELLDEAKNLICGDRNDAYGGPMPDFARTAGALTALGYCRIDDEDSALDLVPSDVAILMATLKLSRLQHSREKRDSWLDAAAYMALGWECVTETEGKA